MSLQTLSRWGRSAYDTAAAWAEEAEDLADIAACLLYTSPSPRD